MMDVRVFNDPVYSTSIDTMFAVLFGHLRDDVRGHAVLPEHEGVQPSEAGFLMLALRLPVVLSPLGGRSSLPRRERSDAGGLSTVVSDLGSWPRATRPVWVVLLGFALVGAAGGLAVTSATTEAMSSIRRNDPAWPRAS